MKILKNQGSFDILTPQYQLDNILSHLELAGRTCYRSEEKITPESNLKFVRSILRSGHHSVIEHESVSVVFFNISRGFTHELVRHRLAAYSQESTRYVDYTKKGVYDLDGIHLEIISPPHQDENKQVPLEDGRLMSFVDMATEVEKFYKALRQAGWTPEDARQILPIGIRSQIVITTNLREWRHILSLRTEKHAHWEIRSVLCHLLQELRLRIPVIFDDFVFVGEDKNGIPYYKRHQH